MLDNIKSFKAAIITCLIIAGSGLTACAMKPSMVLSSDPIGYSKHPLRNFNMLILTANNGDRGSAYILGGRYERGEWGLERNLYMAKQYYEIAVRDTGIEQILERDIDPKTGMPKQVIWAKTALARVNRKLHDETNQANK